MLSAFIQQAQMSEKQTWPERIKKDAGFDRGWCTQKAIKDV